MTLGRPCWQSVVTAGGECGRPDLDVAVTTVFLWKPAPSTRAKVSPSMSTSKRDKCGLTSLLPMSCRDRAEAFARHLHSRLRSLDAEDGEESSWLAAHEASLALSQPRPESDLFFNFGLFESPGSPMEEVAEPDLTAHINKKDNLKPKCLKNGFVRAGNSLDSDSSDGPYFDTESEPSKPYMNGFARPPKDCIESVEPSQNCEEEYSSLECNNNEEPETHSNSLNIEKELTVECPVMTLLTKCDTIEQENPPQESEIFLGVDDDEKETRTPRVRRCSSLKTGKTPPGTPGRKKIVRFADVLGLDLADVRTFLDEIPKIPTSAYDDLVEADITATTVESAIGLPHIHKFLPNKQEKLLVPLFQQPGGQPNFLDRIRESNVCLENAVVMDPVDLCIRGTVRVRNLDFHKSVHIRYTLDSWETFADLQATYVDNTCDGFSDTFIFVLYAHTLCIGQKLEFAVRFQCKGCQYWDSNYGTNYTFQCLPASSTYLSGGSTFDDNWGASFY